MKPLKIALVFVVVLGFFSLFADTARAETFGVFNIENRAGRVVQYQIRKLPKKSESNPNPKWGPWNETYNQLHYGKAKNILHAFNADEIARVEIRYDLFADGDKVTEEVKEINVFKIVRGKKRRELTKSDAQGYYFQFYGRSNILGFFREP